MTQCLDQEDKKGGHVDIISRELSIRLHADFIFAEQNVTNTYSVYLSRLFDARVDSIFVALRARSV